MSEQGTPSGTLSPIQRRPSSLPSESSPRPSASASKRKLSAASSAAHSSSASNPTKKQRTLENLAVSGLLESIENFNDTVSKMYLMHSNRMQADTTLERQVKAVELIQVQEHYLTDDQMVAFLDLFRTEPLVAQVYLALTRESVRRAWVRRVLWKELGFPQDPQ